MTVEKGMTAILIGGISLLPVMNIQAEEPDAAWRKEADRKLEMLTREKEKMGFTGPGKIYEGVRGFAPAASKVYPTAGPGAK